MTHLPTLTYCKGQWVSRESILRACVTRFPTTLTYANSTPPLTTKPIDRVPMSYLRSISLLTLHMFYPLYTWSNFAFSKQHAKATSAFATCHVICRPSYDVKIRYLVNKNLWSAPGGKKVFVIRSFETEWLLSIITIMVYFPDSQKTWYAYEHLRTSQGDWSAGKLTNGQRNESLPGSQVKGLKSKCAP